MWELLELLRADFSTQACGESADHVNTSWCWHICLKFKFICYTVCFAELGDFFPPAAVARLFTSISCILRPLWEFCHLLGYFQRQHLGLLLLWTLAFPISGHILVVISCFTPFSLLVMLCLMEEKDLEWGWPRKFRPKFEWILEYPDLEGIQEDHCVGTLCSCLAIVQLKYILWAVWANFMYLEGEKGNAQWTVSQLHQALSSKKSVFSCLRSFSNTVSNPVRCRESVAKTIFNSERKKKNSGRRLAAGQSFKGSHSASICRNGYRSVCNLHVCLTVAHAMNRCYLLLRAYTLRGRF